MLKKKLLCYCTSVNYKIMSEKLFHVAGDYFSRKRDVFGTTILQSARRSDSSMTYSPSMQV